MAATETRRGPRAAAVTLAMAVLLSACSSLPLFSNDSQRLDDALAEDRYDDALAIIDGADPDDPLNAALLARRPAVLEASHAYRGDALDRARAFGARGDWQKAYQTLDQTSPRVVDNQPLSTLKQQLQAREAARLRERLSRWYLAVGQAVLDSGDLNSELAPFEAARAGAARAEWNRLRNEATVALTDLGHSYANQEQWAPALRLLDMAQRLSPSRQQPAALEQARHHISSSRDRRRSERSEAERRQAQSLVAAYQDSGELNDLLAARTYLMEHPDSAPGALRHQVDAWCQQRFQDAMTRGEALYARGEYRDAYRLWRQVAPLQPDNEELIKKLERSRKVLKNLRSLDET
ncbi:hypothetical protein CEK62_12300 [Alcanivorax sp. N3-2A]|nr:hypothetical protein CEK62_12300 [Alcanivorax sp. N3-2A]|tara:strand:+ start:21210 stop:22259 length:1050 start_codon:yes stop_codon:yes gene_type:complete